ncbi:MAG: heavy metal resistance protein [Caulobacteraceae bacterium]|jgi:Spy/CpxP family protein refolding chaperone|nr:heavy metal resistance protein [Caulobacteraceae bacterium]
MNSAFWRNLLITIVLAGLAAFVGARLGAGHLQPQPARSRLLLRETVYEMVHQNLTLTPEQQRRIDQIEDRYAHQRNSLRAQIGSANAELGEALANEMALGTAAQRALEHLQSSMGELQKQTILYVLEVRAVLTPQQQQVLDQKVFESLTIGPF